MYQSDRGNYRKQDSLISIFMNTCLGKAVIYAFILGIITLIAILSRPSKEYMLEEMNDNIRQCLERTDSTYMDGVDNAIANIGYIFSHAKSKQDSERMKTFKRLNRLEYYNHGVFSTLRLINNYHYEGSRCAIGFFGIVIPIINSNDFVLRSTPIRKEYNNKAVTDIEEDYYIDKIDEYGEDFLSGYDEDVFKE